MSNIELSNQSEVATVQVTKSLRVYFLITAALCGAIVMVIEILGSRVIGPFFGVSLFVWTSLITVTLLALALGYAVGGQLSDRFNHSRYLYLIIILSALFCLAIPLMKGVVLKASMSLGLRGGAFTAALILFGPTLFLLGCVSPYLVKLCSRHWQNVGKTVGGLYALSTLGSTLGSLVTGFWMVGYLGIDKSLYFIGLSLTLCALGYFAIFERNWKPFLILILPALSYPQSQHYNKQLSDGTVLNQLDQVENYYGSIKVLESVSQTKHARYLLLENMIQGGIDIQNGLSVFPYTYHMQYLSVATNPKGYRCLAIGMGIGIVPKWLEQQGRVCDVVDINPDIFRIAEQYFNYVPKGARYVQDGRYFLMHSEAKYDYVLLDAFSGEQTPTHLLSVEAMQAISHKLNDGGVLCINIISRVDGAIGITSSLYKTLKAVFDSVQVYPVLDLADNNFRNKIGNIIFLAYQGKPRPLDFSIIADADIHPYYRNRIAGLLGKKYEIRDFSKALLLSDDYNPIDYFEAEAREEIRLEVLKGIDLDFQLL